MALDTYSALQTAIANFLNRADLTATIPDFITLAEAQVRRRINKAWQEQRPLPRAMVAVADLASLITPNQQPVTLPTDFIGAITTRYVTTSQRVKYLSPNAFTQEETRRGVEASAFPEFYTVRNNTLIFRPAPDAQYHIELWYWQQFTALSGSNASNWILASHSDVYLYGALTQSAPYLMDDARVPVWNTLFNSALEDLINSDPYPADEPIRIAGLSTYANLQASVANIIQRSDLDPALPDFITAAEARIRRRLRAALEKGHNLPRNMAVKTTVTINAEYGNVPTDFLGGVISFSIEPQTVNGQTVGAVQLDYLNPMNLELLKQRRGPSAAADIPGVYSIMGAQFQYLPIPDYTYTGTLWYWQDFTSLLSGTNWIIQKHPDVYLYAALLAAAPYLKDDDRVQMWPQMFEQEMTELLKADPLPNDRSWLRMDSGLTYRPNDMSGFNINTGDFSSQP